MTKYELFQLVWSGYYHNQGFDSSYYMDDLSGWSYDEMTESFNWMVVDGLHMSHKVDFDGRVYPVFFA